MCAFIIKPKLNELFAFSVKMFTAKNHARLIKLRTYFFIILLHYFIVIYKYYIREFKYYPNQVYATTANIKQLLFEAENH